MPITTSQAYLRNSLIMGEVVRKGAKVYCCRHLPLKDYQLGEANRLFKTHQLEFRICRKSATRSYLIIYSYCESPLRHAWAQYLSISARLCIFKQKKQSFGKILLQHTACQSMTAKGLPGKQELQDEKELTTQNSCSRSLALRTNHRMLSGSTS